MDKLNNKEHFKVPKGYFKDFNKNLSLKRAENPFIVPSNYFEDFQINTKKIKSYGKLINLKKMILPVAASIIFGFFIFNLLPNTNDFEIDYEIELYSLNDYELIDLIDFDNIKTENLLDQDDSYNYFVNTITYEDDLLILD
ncbi:MAG: hypothetical protein VYB19_04690 [Bacteroidota bacterium]|nr:hypothetical protein [Bacteroidota bacterium]MEE2605435.1 hypothetical protein [Bacteroidota bacterium]